jgi:hypothetical protein
MAFTLEKAGHADFGSFSDPFRMYPFLGNQGGHVARIGIKSNLLGVPKNARCEGNLDSAPSRQWFLPHAHRHPTFINFGQSTMGRHFGSNSSPWQPLIQQTTSLISPDPRTAVRKQVHSSCAWRIADRVFGTSTLLFANPGGNPGSFDGRWSFLRTSWTSLSSSSTGTG